MLKTSVSRIARIEANIFEVLLAFLAFSAVVTYVALPSSFRASAIELAFGRWAYLWLVGYAVAGVLILVGIWLFRQDFEAAGLMLLSASVAINGIAIVAVFGFTLLPALGAHTATMGACIVKTRSILKARVIAVLSVSDEGDDVGLTTSFEDQASHEASLVEQDDE